jgi:hypothetical protein
MNISKLLIVLLILFSTCKKDDEFNTEVIPGEYTGSVYYWQLIHNDDGDHLINDPNLSSGMDYKTIITKDGSNYILSFDKSSIYTIPDISIKIISFINSDIASIKTLEGQAYSSSEATGKLPGYPANYFSIDKYIHRIDCNLTLGSKDPDSTYFLQFILLRIY